ncbi:MAG: YncE family protein, partial [Planctomycetota bacterium]
MSDSTRSARKSVYVSDAGPRNRLAVILAVLAFAAPQFTWAQRSRAQRYLGPSDVVVCPKSERLYVACADAQQVLWVALPGGDIQRRVDVPAPATGITLWPESGQLFVTCPAAAKMPGGLLGGFRQVAEESGKGPGDYRVHCHDRSSSPVASRNR